MTARNAFENIATEAKQDDGNATLVEIEEAVTLSTEQLALLVSGAAQAAVLAAVEALGQFTVDHARENDASRLPPFARDPQQRLRNVNEGGNVQANQYLFNTATQGATMTLGGYATWWSRDVFTMDQREQQREQTRQSFQATRNRWSLT